MPHLLLVCEEEEFRLVSVQLPRDCLAGTGGLPSLKDLDRAPMVWVRPEVLVPPADRDSPEYVLWAQIMHRVSGRTLVRLLRLRRQEEVRDARLARAWLERRVAEGNRYQGEIQEQVRSKPEVLILIHETEPNPEFLGSLEQFLAPENGPGIVCYLMTWQLRVQTSAQRLAMARHVWPLAVGPLLRRLLWLGLPKSEKGGFYAWRALEVFTQGNRGDLDARIEREQERFVDWLKRVESQDRTASPIVDKLRLDEKGDEPAGKETNPARPAASWAPRLRGLLRFLQRGVRAGHLDPERRPPALWSDTTREEVALVNFAGLQADGGSSAPVLVDQITDPERIAEAASRQGLEARVVAQREWDEMPASPDSPEWTAAAQNPLPRGGPAKPHEMFLTAQQRLSASDEPGALKAMLQQWARELGRERIDVATRRERLRLCARELQEARKAFVSLWPRIVIGVFCLLIVMSVTLQALRAWSGFWFFGADGLPLALMEMRYVVFFTVAAAAGALCGVFLPYLIERHAGGDAAEALTSRARGLKRDMVAILDRRIRLAGLALRVMAPQLAQFSGYRMMSALASRAWAAANRVLGNRSQWRAGQESRPDVLPGGLPFEDDDGAAFSLRAYQDLCRASISLPQGPAVPTLDGEPEDPRKQQEQWADVFRRCGWCDLDTAGSMPQADVFASGWFPARRVSGLLRRALDLVRERHERPADGTRSDWGNEQAPEVQQLRRCVQQWAPAGAGTSQTMNLGMMSVQYRSGKDSMLGHIQTHVMAPEQDSIDAMVRLLRQQSVQVGDSEDLGPEARAGLKEGRVLACILQEARLRLHRPDAREGRGSGGASPDGPEGLFNLD